MGRSLSFAAYRALSRRTETRDATQYPPRPDGELVWVQASEPETLQAIIDLAQRLCLARDGLAVLITVSDETALKTALGTRSRRKSSVILIGTPSEHPDAVAVFLDQWKPDICLWAWGRLRPNLVMQTAATGCALILIDGDGSGFDGKRDRWLPEVTRRLMEDFSVIMVRSGAAVRRLEQFGIDTKRLELTAPLQAGGQALACNDTELSEMSAVLAGRQVWLATGVQTAELSVVLNAHRQALRLSHRLLLILNPAKGLKAQDCIEAARSNEFRISDWGAGRQPDEATQILVADDPEDLGLFYRLAPVSFLGSSLRAGQSGRNPFEAAALGSAVLYGPNVRHYLPFYSRLAAAGAARIVNDATSLANAVTRLIAPDQAAAMAHAGWDVISQGAEQTDRIIELVQTTLDRAEGAT